MAYEPSSKELVSRWYDPNLTKLDIITRLSNNRPSNLHLWGNWGNAYIAVKAISAQKMLYYALVWHYPKARRI